MAKPGKDLSNANKTRLEKLRKAKEVRMPQLALLFTCGYSLSEIAVSLKVSTKTIGNEIKELKEGWARNVGNIDLDDLIGQMIAEALIRKRRANEIFVKAANNLTKVSILKLLADEDQRIVNLLQSVGKLFEKPKEMIIENTYEIKARQYFEERGSDGITELFGKLAKSAGALPDTGRTQIERKH